MHRLNNATCTVYAVSKVRISVPYGLYGVRSMMIDDVMNRESITDSRSIGISLYTKQESRQEKTTSLSCFVSCVSTVPCTVVVSHHGRTVRFAKGWIPKVVLTVREYHFCCISKEVLVLTMISILHPRIYHETATSFLFVSCD